MVKRDSTTKTSVSMEQQKMVQENIIRITTYVGLLYVCVRERERERGRERDRQTDRQRQRERHRQTDRWPETE